MAHRITINQVPLNLGLPGIAEVTVTGTVFTLSDDQFAQISPAALTNGWITDNGYVGTGAVTVQANFVAQAAALTSAQNATAAAATQTSSYVQADVQTIATLANALKTSYNQLQTDVAALQSKINAELTALQVANGPQKSS